jgi:type I restriction enzyme, S subunit
VKAVPLGEAAITIMGQAPPGKDCNKEGRGTIFIKAGEFNGRIPIVREWTTKPLKIAKASDVLVCVVGATAGKISGSIDCAIGQSVAAVRPNPTMLDTDYLYHFLSTRTGALRTKSQGLAQGVITREMLEDTLLPLPSLDAQRRIAAILDQADDLRGKRQNALSKVNELPGQVLFESCGEPASNPMDWPITRLGDLCSSVSDGPHVSPEYVEAGIPFLSTRNIRSDGIVWSDLKFISNADAQIQWKKVKPTRGDVLYTKGGTTGIARAVDFDLEFAVWVHVAVLKLLKDKVEPVWLQEMLNSAYCYHQSQRLTKGIVNRDLGLRRMVDITFPLPPIELQRAVAARVAEIEKLKAHQRVHLAKLDALFASLQHRAFRGEL